MAELAIDRGFLPAYARLQRRVQRAVDAAIRKFAEHAHTGLHLEKLSGARDPKIHLIPIDQAYQGVVFALGEQKYVLLDVLPHDDAIAFAVSRRFTVNQVLGMLEMRDQAGIEEFASTTPSRPPTGGLFDGISTADLLRLGVDADLVPLLRLISTDRQLESLGRRLPEVQLDILNGLASGMAVEEVWAEVADRIVSGVDTDDLGGRGPPYPGTDRFRLRSGGAGRDPRPPVRRVAHLPAPHATRCRLPGDLQRPCAGHRQRRHRQDRHRTAPGGLPRPAAAAGRVQGAPDHVYPCARRGTRQTAVPTHRQPHGAGPHRRGQRRQAGVRDRHPRRPEGGGRRRRGAGPALGRGGEERADVCQPRWSGHDLQQRLPPAGMGAGGPGPAADHAGGVPRRPPQGTRRRPAGGSTRAGVGDDRRRRT